MTRRLRGEVTGLDQSDAMLEVAARAGPRTRPSSRATRSTCRSRTARSSASSPSYFYCHLEEDDRERFLAEARRVAPSSSSSAAGCSRTRSRERWDERVLNDGTRWRVYKRVLHSRTALAAELGGGGVLHAEPLLRDGRSPSTRVTRRRSAYRSLASLQRDNRALPRVRRGGLPARVAAGARGARRPARVHLRPGARDRRGRGAPAVARPRRPDPPPLARARRGRVLRDLLLRLGHALLSRAGRRPARATASPTPREQELCSFWLEWELRLLRPELIVAVGGLAIRRLLGRPQPGDCIGTSLRARRRDRRPAPAPVRRQPLAERPGEPRPAGGRALGARSTPVSGAKGGAKAGG